MFDQEKRVLPWNGTGTGYVHDQLRFFPDRKDPLSEINISFIFYS